MNINDVLFVPKNKILEDGVGNDLEKMLNLKNLKIGNPLIRYLWERQNYLNHYESFAMNDYLNDECEYDNIFKTFDAFICSHPNSFVLFFEKYNKPIYIINSCRYDLPFCWTNNYDMINKLNNCFTRLQNKNLLTFISNNKADNAYFKLANPSIETKMLPSLCLYTKMTWNPLNTCDEFLL